MSLIITPSDGVQLMEMQILVLALLHAFNQPKFYFILGAKAPLSLVTLLFNVPLAFTWLQLDII